MHNWLYFIQVCGAIKLPGWHELDKLFFFKNKFQNGDHSREIVVALSPQSIANLCVELGQSNELKSACPDTTSPDVVRAFCDRLLRSNGVALVLDTTWSRDISLAESAEEFLESWNSVISGLPSKRPELPILSGICPGVVLFIHLHF